MFKMILGILTILISTGAFAAPTGNLFLNPYYPVDPEPGTTALSFFDSNLHKDLTNFSERRQRVQTFLVVEHSPDQTDLIESDSFVLRRIFDRGMSAMMKSDSFRKTRLGKTANQLKDNMQTGLVVTDEKNVTHKFDFKLAPFQGFAFLQYSGFTKMQLRYNLRDGGAIAMIFRHELAPGSSIGIENTMTGANRGQLLTLNFSW